MHKLSKSQDHKLGGDGAPSFQYHLVFVGGKTIWFYFFGSTPVILALKRPLNFDVLGLFVLCGLDAEFVLFRFFDFSPSKGKKKGKS